MVSRFFSVVTMLMLLTASACLKKTTAKQLPSGLSCDPAPEGSFDDSVVPGGAAFVEYFEYGHAMYGQTRTDMLVQDYNDVFQAGDVYDDQEGGFSDISGAPATAEGLRAWIDERVNYIIPQQAMEEAPCGVECYDELISRGVDLGSFSYPAYAKYNAQIVMSNSGAWLYEVGRERGSLVGYQLPHASDNLDETNSYQSPYYGSDVNDPAATVQVSSPRAGIVQVGPGLYAAPPVAGITSFIRQVDRAGVLAHEARHSDGSGSNIGFPHIECPTDFDGNESLIGLSACEVCAGGPYAIGAQYYTLMARSCDDLSGATASSDCNQTNIAYLQFLAADSQSRIIE